MATVRSLLREALQSLHSPARILARLNGIESAGDCFTEVTVRLEPGDALPLYTDGVTEAPSSEGASLFGVERLLRSVERLPDLTSLREWAETIRQAVETHSASQQLPDDLTLLLLRRPG